MSLTSTGPAINAHLHLTLSSWVKRPSVPVHKSRPRRPAWAAYNRTSERQEIARSYGAADSLEEKARLLMQEFDDAGLDIACLQAIDRELTGHATLSHWDVLQELARLQAVYPSRLILFCGINARRGREGVELLERAVKELGYAGLGEQMPHEDFVRPDDKELCFPLYERCVELGIPVAINCTGSPAGHHDSSYCHPLLVEKVANAFPNLNICLAGGGTPYFEEFALGLAQLKPNVFLSMEDWQKPENRRRFFDLLDRAMRSPARFKIMYGSDHPVYHGLYSEKEWIDIIQSEGAHHGFRFTDEEWELFFSQNFQDFVDRDLA